MYLYYILQLILMVPLSITICFALFEPGILIFTGLIQFVLGVEQVMGGLIQAVLYKSKLHLKYSIGAILYVLFLIFSQDFISNNNNLLAILFIGIIPWTIAIWYTYICYRYYKTAPKSKFLKNRYEDDEFILDDTRGL